MMNNKLQKSILFVVSGTLACCHSSLKRNQKENAPNIIIIFTDDQGYNDLGCYGAKGFETPNIDSLSSEGMRFTDFYVAANVCSPSRAALLTGCYPQRVGIPEVLAPCGPEWTKGRSDIGLNPDETTLPEMLKTKGYATACIGKWHLGHHKDFLPVHNGFDEFFGLPYSNDMRPETDTTYPPLPLMKGDSVIQTNPDQQYLTTWYTEYALDFIKRNSSKPFFLYLAHSMPHVPLYVSEKFRGKSQQGLYGDVIMEIDWSVGQIVTTLKGLGIDKNTLIIFTSDNGPWLVYGNHAGSAYPLREGKSTTFEGGQREACIMVWPGKIPVGSECHEVISTIDLLPTIAEITGAELPQNKIDGLSILPILKDEKNAKSPHDAFYFYTGDSLEAIRSGKWKLYFPHKYRTVTDPGKDGAQGITREAETGYELYDLENDISEKINVIDQHPGIAEDMKEKASRFDKELKYEKRQPGIVLKSKADSI